MFSSILINKVKLETKYTGGEILHEHDDCIRMAYEWLDAQKKTIGVSKKIFAIKHIIEKWSGRYISQSDVDVAAHIHPEVKGYYPYFNISSRLTLPNIDRLKGILQAHTQDYEIDESSRKLYYREE
jgi:hypothetical protein